MGVNTGWQKSGKVQKKKEGNLTLVGLSLYFPCIIKNQRQRVQEELRVEVDGGVGVAAV